MGRGLGGSKDRPVPGVDPEPTHGGRRTRYRLRHLAGGVLARLRQARGRHFGCPQDASLFEIGCGAGAFLYDFYRSGHSVGGLDLSPSLVAYAQAAMPGADITRGEASSFDAVASYDFVISCGVFMYFDSLNYARGVIHQAVAGTRIGVAILDIPDRATEQDAVAARRAAVGPEVYDERYRGLPHLFYERDWVEAELRSAGAQDVRIEGQSIADYDNGAFRFNAFAWIDGAPAG